MKMTWAISLACLIFSLNALGDTVDCSSIGFAPKTTQVNFSASSTPFTYTVQIGFLPVATADQTGHACMAYTSYTRNDTANSPTRPISFLMNGGPGSSSDWIHFAGVGPMRMNFGVDGTDLTQGSTLSPNPNTLLDFSDLVFVDPIGTGYSVLASGTQLSQFQGVDEDADSIGDFINMYLTTYQKTSVPKFVIGESYSGTRVPVLADYLFKTWKTSFSGMILISPQLDAIGDSEDLGNDLPYVTHLPSYATVNWYHKLLAPQYQQLALEDVYQKAKIFANGPYSAALQQGNALDDATQASMIQQLQDLTGIPQETWGAWGLRISTDLFPEIPFNMQPMETPKTIVSFYDGRVASSDPNVDPLLTNSQLDAAADNYFSSTFSVAKTVPYVSSYDPFANGKMWNTDNNGAEYEGAYRSGLQQLDSDLFNMPSMKVYVATGLFDGIVPTGDVEYLLGRISVFVSGRIQVSHYAGGHMVYMGSDNAKKLHTELQTFYQSTTPQAPTPVAK